MAKVATPGSLASDADYFREGAMKLKRKTPSELRGEQLKRTAIGIGDNSSTPLQNSILMDCGLSKTDPPKNTRYVEMRLDEVYRIKKPSSTHRLLLGKATAKENVSSEGNTISSTSNLVCKAQHESNCQSTSADSIAITNDEKQQQRRETEKCNQNRFLSVAELSLGSERFADSGTVDVDKALKGLVSREPSSAPSLANSSADSADIKKTSAGNICLELTIPGRKVPVDFTLKTSMRVQSSSPITWFRRLLMSGTYNGIPQSSAHRGTVMPHSWVYPQSSLPPYLISTLSSAGGDIDFLSKRQVAWEDSFRNLYYLMRKNTCNIFYVYTSQFVVMFTAVGGDGKSKRNCNAYISQSTRGLRSLLREHDVTFSMPLCSSEVEQISREDLVELSEIEKHNLGQAKRLMSTSDLDNSPESLLSFHLNESVHSLYDFMLNYKSYLPTLAGVDVPMLYSPVPFQNASLLAPEVRCKEIKTADHYAMRFQTSSQKGQSILDSSGGINYSIEVKGECIPPWVVSSLCAAMVSSESSFEASFATDPNCIGLNFALKGLDLKCDTQPHKEDSSQESSNTYGIPFAIVSPDLHSAPLKGLKYRDDSYMVSLLPF